VREGRSERVWTYLKPYDLDYLDAVRVLLSGNPPKMSRGEALRFCLRLLRAVLPRVELITRVVPLVLEKNLDDRGR